jgi:uncharacterized CHY-type Zn-finger protein
MNDRFVERMRDGAVAHDTRVLADFVAIYCDGHHRLASRGLAGTDAALLGVYGSKRPVLCAECSGHLAYAEKRRAQCPKDPKPFCSHCDTHCYQSGEREWQRSMMRYSGPRSWTRGHAIDGIRHVLEARRHRKQMARRSGTGPAETKE